jgi:hypothetical protein
MTTIAVFSISRKVGDREWWVIRLSFLAACARKTFLPAFEMHVEITTYPDVQRDI